jgi:hypothetical protein
MIYVVVGSYILSSYGDTGDGDQLDLLGPNE